LPKVNSWTPFSIVITPETRACAATAKECKLPKEKGSSDVFRQEVVDNKRKEVWTSRGENGRAGLEADDDVGWLWSLTERKTLTTKKMVLYFYVLG
jgi:hypothetical protein